MAIPAHTSPTAPGGPTSAMAGPPLDTIAHLIAGPRVDHVLRRAAGRRPDGLAVRSPSGDITYAELDTRTDAIASGLRALTGEPGSVIALAAVLDPVFPGAFFGISRSGNISALVNPLLPEERITHVLRVCGARVAIISPAMFPVLAAVRDRLEGLEHVVLTHRSPDLPPDAGPTLADIAAGAPAFVEAPDADADSVACLQFTSGTTGAPKAARLSHRNLTVNAAQTAYMHQVDETSVLFNHLPTLHLMHVTVSAAVAATHVLWPGADVAEAVTAASAYRATHYYSLPMRLAKLAADPRLHDLEAPSLRAVLSGGSALAPDAASVLSQHLGIPVVQGYGLAETSPSVHLSDLDRPRGGSSGVLVPGAESRVVDVASQVTLPVRERGEIQVRGPQLMLGYLGRDLSHDVDADGWFSTGDIGWIDADGSLYVVDRLKDAFKCDNWLVSPTEVERVLLRHPAVADCVVVDVPHELSGAVAHALVVPANQGCVPRDVIDFVNDKVAYYEHLHHVELVERIARSATGKVQRRELREQHLRNLEV
ncbi:class I adenylate-forming enzyme family protein [Actinokineospora sp. NBRC 105648]|uniref:class I adenylate-forming enzyme family protein n=1 Tax=Actinokineospora sp. NBRC 105648 TaxID=3032206 RepID=UPI0024A3E127|nr:class I adenylate-forming enzyme family protein [Actinokineospora sp. NBRC 105648]GLZ36607.1 AMP-dependent synthetase [Actinokineospora sp. NBRC 105648]